MVKDGNYAKVSGTFEIFVFLIIVMLISDGAKHSKLLFSFLQFRQNEHLKTKLMENAGRYWWKQVAGMYCGELG